MATTDNLTFRVTEQRPLFYEEVDANFRELETLIDEYNQTTITIGDIQTEVGTKIGDAPIDGGRYVRKDGGWVTFQSGIWGEITGTLSDQTDLNNRFTSVEDDVNVISGRVDDIEPIITTTSVNKTLVNTERCFTTISTLTITLPATPTEGYFVSVGVEDYGDTIVARNGSNIMGLAEDITLDKENVVYTFLYVDASFGWRIII